MSGEITMRQWKAHYKDEFHDEDIVIINEEGDKFDNLTFTIDGISFQGGDISTFELKDPAQAEQTRERFCLLKWGGYMPEIDFTSPYTYALQRYALDLQIPIRVMRTADGSEAEGILYIGYRLEPHDMAKTQVRYYCDDRRVWLDGQLVTDFRFAVDGVEYALSCDSLWMEEALTELVRLLRPKYALRCCFTCQWSDYSPYGSDDFGTMLCYRANKAEYLRVNGKDEYFEYLEALPCQQRQETYHCSDYAPRDQCGGYRGYVE